MANYPTGIELRSDYVIVEDIENPSIVSLPGKIRLGEAGIRQLPYEYGSYTLDDVVAYDKNATTYFQQGGFNFGILPESAIIFITTPAP